MALLLLLGPSGLSVVQTECVCRLVYDFSQKEPKKEALSTELMNRSLFCYSIRSKQICWKIFHLGSVNDKPFFFACYSYSFVRTVLQSSLLISVTICAAVLDEVFDLESWCFACSFEDKISGSNFQKTERQGTVTKTRTAQSNTEYNRLPQSHFQVSIQPACIRPRIRPHTQRWMCTGSLQSCHGLLLVCDNSLTRSKGVQSQVPNEIFLWQGNG